MCIFIGRGVLLTARRWGALSAVLGNDSADLMIAATALEHGLTVVTRNVSDFEPPEPPSSIHSAVGQTRSRRRSS